MEIAGGVVMAIDKISNPAFSTLAVQRKPVAQVKPNLSTAATEQTVKPEGFAPGGRPVVRESTPSTRNTEAPAVPGGRPVPVVKPAVSTAAQAPQESAPGGRPVPEVPDTRSFVYSRTAATKKI